MIPVKLTISGFLSYQEPVTIDFTPLRVACITGRNGAGKSSLLDAMTWALFGEGRARDDRVINDQAPNNTAKVDLEFDYEGASYLVRRSRQKGKTGTIEFFIMNSDGNWKPLSEKRSADTTKLICDTLHMDYKTFTNVSFFLQGKADQFTGEKPTERKNILSRILNLDVWEDYKNRATEKRKKVESEIGQLRRLVNENRDDLQDEAEIRAGLEVVRAELTKAREEFAKADENWKLAKTAEASLKSMKNILDQKLQDEMQQKGRIEKLNRDLLTSRRDLSSLQLKKGEAEVLKNKCSTLAELRKQAESLSAAAIEYNRLHSRSVSLNGTIQTTEKQLRYEHGQLSALKNDIDRKAAELETLKDSSDRMQTEQLNLAGQIAAIESQEKQRDALKETEAHLKAECRTITNNGRELNDKIAYLQTNQGGTCPTCGREMDQEHCSRHIADLEKQVRDLRSQYTEKNSGAQKIGRELQALELKIAELGRLRARQNKLTGENAALLQQIRTIEKNIADWDEVKGPRLREVERILQEADFCTAEREELKAIRGRIAELGYDPRVDAEIQQRIRELGDVEGQYRALVISLSRIEQLEQAISSMNEQLSEEQTRLENLQKERAEAEQKYLELKEQLPDLAAIDALRTEAMQAASRLETRLGEAQQRVKHLEDARANAERYEKEIIEKSRLLEQYKTLEKAFGKDGIPAMLIEQSIPEIEEQANQLLQQLSDGTMSLKINTQGSFKSKKESVKETLDILIEDAYGVRDYEMFSGGEAFRINFSLRLALSRILAHRSGSRLQTLVIDEGFGSQDTEGRELLVDAISKIQHDFEKILIITHLDELKERFPSRIEVTKTAQGSRVEVIP